MRAFAPALLFTLLLFALLITQVDSAVNPFELLRRNGGSISWVVDIEVPDDGSENENEAENPPIYVEAIIEADLDVDLGVDMDLENTTAKTKLSISDDDSSSFVKNKMLWHVEDIDEKVEDIQSGDVQKSMDSPLEVRIEHTVTQEAKHNEEDALAPNGSGTDQMEGAREIDHVLEDSKGTESSGISSRLEETDSRKGNVSSQGSDRSTTTTETARHMVLEERQVMLEERQMAGGGGKAPATKEANETLSVSAEDPQKEIELTNGSRSVGPEREKETSIGSEATLRRTNQERDSVPKDASETTQVAAKPTVQRQVATTTESAGTSRSTKEKTAAAETDGVKSAEDATSGKGLNTSLAARSFESQDAAETGVETPAKVTLAFVEEKREIVRSDEIQVGKRDYGRRRRDTTSLQWA